MQASNRMREDRAVAKSFWFRWVAANAIGEFVGLGAVAGIGFLLFRQFADDQSWQQAVLVAAAFVGLGAFEGFVVGLAQATVLRRLLPVVRGWIAATVIGAMVAWAVGMLPSIFAQALAPSDGAPAAEPSLGLVLLLAAGLGAVAGPVLAAFQWRSLRRALPARAWVWLPANAAAWCLGMPVIFLGAQANELTADPALIVLLVGLALLAAGAVVGAVHGWFLLRLARDRHDDHAA